MSARAARRRAAAPARAPAFSFHGSEQISAAEERLITRLVWALAGLLAIALVAMIVGPHRIGDYMTETDFYGAYAEGARLIQHGRLLPERYTVIGPGYEVMLGLVGFAIRDLFVAAELLSIVASLVTLLAWFELLRRRTNVRVAGFAALFIATNATFFRHGYGAMTDAPAIALQAGALLLLFTRAGDRAVIGAGLLAALAFLTRYNAVVLLPAGLVALLAGATPAGRRGRAALLYLAAFAAPVLPWVLYSLAHGGGASIQLHHNIAYEVFARARGIPWDVYQRDLQPQFKTLWDVIERDPGAVFGRMLFNLGDHLRRDALELLGWPLAAAAAAGLALGAFDGMLKRLWPLLVVAALLFATLVPVFYSVRYSLALLPYYAALAGIAFASPIAALVMGHGRRVALKPLLAVVPVAVALLANWRVEARVIDQLPMEVLECARALDALKRPDDRVIARKWHIAYHAGVSPLAFPFAKRIPELAEYARQNRARWLYFSWPEAETRPDFAYLLDTTATVPGLTVRCATRPHPAVLYEIGPDFGREPAWFANDTLMAYHRARAALMIDINDLDALYRLGGLSWIMGRPAEAVRALETLLRRQPDRLDALLLLGNARVTSGDARGTRDVYEHAARIAPNHPEVRIGLGWAALLAGDLQEAGRLWRPMIAMTSNPDMPARMAELYRTIGDPQAEAEARAAARRLEAAP